MELAINRVVVGVNTDDVPTSWIYVKSASRWVTGPTTVTNARSQLLRVLRSMAFHLCSFLLFVSMSQPKSAVNPFVVFWTVVAKGV